MGDRKNVKLVHPGEWCKRIALVVTSNIWLVLYACTLVIKKA